VHVDARDAKRPTLAACQSNKLTTTLTAQ